MGEQSEGIGVTFEMSDVIPENLRQLLLQRLAWSFGEECLDGFLSTMSERRVTQVVREACRGDYLSYLFEQGATQLRTFAVNKLCCNIVAQRHADTGHLKRVSQSVMDEDTARQREHLCLVLQTSERCREDKTVIVALELRAIVVTLGVAVFLPKPFVGYELLPVHLLFTV